MGSAKTLIIGAGEIGTSLCNVLRDAYEVHIRDVADPQYPHRFTVLHLCYPYTEQFIETARAYMAQYEPALTIVHSTVKPGTTRQLGKRVVYSPVIGRHPHLEEGIRTFTKWLGAVDHGDAEDACVYFELAGVHAELMESPEAAELAKVCCTTAYGWMILVQKEIHRLCEQYGVPFDQVYKEWTIEYNRGYLELEQAHFARPVLQHMPGPSGGHCILNNCKLLDDWFTNTLQERNATY